MIHTFLLYLKNVRVLVVPTRINQFWFSFPPHGHGHYLLSKIILEHNLILIIGKATCLCAGTARWIETSQDQRKTNTLISAKFPLFAMIEMFEWRNRGSSTRTWPNIFQVWSVKRQNFILIIHQSNCTKVYKYIFTTVKLCILLLFLTQWLIIRIVNISGRL